MKMIFSYITQLPELSGSQHQGNILHSQPPSPKHHMRKYLLEELQHENSTTPYFVKAWQKYNNGIMLTVETPIILLQWFQVSESCDFFHENCGSLLNARSQHGDNVIFKFNLSWILIDHELAWVNGCRVWVHHLHQTKPKTQITHYRPVMQRLVNINIRN